MTLPITDREQIKYLLNTCDETITREIIWDDPWKSQTKCNLKDSDSPNKCYPE